VALIALDLNLKKTYNQLNRRDSAKLSTDYNSTLAYPEKEEPVLNEQRKTLSGIHETIACIAIQKIRFSQILPKTISME
jgi:hypothetical protein